ncbi:MAG: hypothetical protein EA001_06465 [Oscillatoriales cyanobacterium]|nr:MAG: hypothetical protein EA001_06465 [Oscillatoriales cyanobacterium]
MTAGLPLRPQSLPLWLEWTLVSSVGAGLAGLIQGALFLDPTNGIWPLLGPLLSAPIVGILQGLAIRSRLGRGRDWAIATAIGMVLGIAAGGLLLLLMIQLKQHLPSGGIIPVILVFPVGAAVQGWMQSRVLRSRLSRPNWWIGVCALAWLINLVPLLLVGISTLGLAQQSLPGFWALNGLASGAVVGLVSGTGLGILLAEGRSPLDRP